MQQFVVTPNGDFCMNRDFRTKNGDHHANVGYVVVML